MALIYLMWKLHMHFYEKHVAKETSKILKCTYMYIVYICIFWIWRVRNHVTRQIGEYEICLASMISKSLAILASMNFPLCRTLLTHAHLKCQSGLLDQTSGLGHKHFNVIVFLSVRHLFVSLISHYYISMLVSYSI